MQLKSSDLTQDKNISGILAGDVQALRLAHINTHKEGAQKDEDIISLASNDTRSSAPTGGDEMEPGGP